MSELAPIGPGETWRMTVVGRAVPQGDLSAVPLQRRDGSPVIGKGGRQIVNMIHSNEKTLKPWRQEIAQAAVMAGWPGGGLAALEEAVLVRITFDFTRPAAHEGTGRNAGIIKDSAPLYPEKTGGDVDKLARAVLDALTGHVWKDDKLIVGLSVRRRYAQQERIHVTVRRPRVRTVAALRELRDRNPLAAEAIDHELQMDLFAALPSTETAAA